MSGGDVYHVWVETDYASTSTYVVSAWSTWNGAAAGCGTCTNVWNTWTADSHNTVTYDTSTCGPVVWAKWQDGVLVQSEVPVVPVETTEQRAERIWSENERIKAEQERLDLAIERRRIADEKAFDLLMEVLDEGQQAMMRKDGSFVVVGSKSGKTYRIRKGLAGNVEMLGPEDKAFERWCFHVPHGIPEYDNMVAQKLMLELHEEDAARIANKTRVNC